MGIISSAAPNTPRMGKVPPQTEARPAPENASPGDAPPDEPSPPPDVPEPPRIWWHAPLVLLALLAAASTVYFLASWVRFQQFFAETWDMGLNMQLLWTTTHGSLLWEAGDFESVHANSFLFVHSTYVAVPLSYLYSVAPTAPTLFAIQAVAVASAAIPLFLIGRRAGSPDWLLYGGVAVYLFSLPVLSGFLFDFHWEAFLPLEFLSVFYLWDRGRLWFAALATVIGCLTLEVFPFLVVGIVVYFAVPFVRQSFPIFPLRQGLRRVGALLRGPALPLVGLLAVAALGYLVPRLLADYALPIWLGGAPTAQSTSGYVVLGIRVWDLTASDAATRLLYWFVLFASFGFLPLFTRQRSLILSAPWAIYTVFMARFDAYTLLGYQYSLIAVAPIALGFIQGLGTLSSRPDPSRRWRMSSPMWLVLLLPFLIASLTDSLLFVQAGNGAPWAAVVIGSVVVAGVLGGYFVSRRGRGASRRFGWIHNAPDSTVSKVALTSAVVILIVANVAMSPLNPVNFEGPGRGSYSFSFSPSPSYAYMAGVAGQIPAGAYVLASANLFPYVANNPHAYSTLWYPGTPTYLPFDSKDLPQYVLLSTSQWFVPDYLTNTLFKTSDYGIVTTVYSSISWPGSIFLFHLHYKGATTVQNATAFPATTILCGNDLALGPSGVVVPDPDSRCGSVIESRPAANLSGNGATIWYGPYATLLPGRYTATISLEGNLSGPGPSNAPVLRMDANASGTSFWYNVVISSDRVSTSHWTNFTFHFNVTRPTPKAEWRGYIVGPTVGGVFVPGFARLNYIELNYSAGPPSGG